jgi:lipoyl(octanoyl) transferase
MAIDAALLESGLRHERSIVRIYRWSEPTVTLGHFQKELSDVPITLRQLPVVRRLSGGGAILHDREITYSCVLPASHPARCNPSSMYRSIHAAIIKCLVRQNVDCGIRSDRPFRKSGLPDEETASADQAFLCFQREDTNDVVMESGQKIIGSAQRRRKGVTLQHGSVLLRASQMAPEIPGIIDLVPEFDARRLTGDLPEAVASSVGGEVTQRVLTDSETRHAECIELGIHMS